MRGMAAADGMQQMTELGKFTLAALRRLYHEVAPDDAARSIIFKCIVDILACEGRDGEDYSNHARIYLEQLD